MPEGTNVNGCYSCSWSAAIWRQRSELPVRLENQGPPATCEINLDAQRCIADPFDNDGKLVLCETLRLSQCARYEVLDSMVVLNIHGEEGPDDNLDFNIEEVYHRDEVNQFTRKYPSEFRVFSSICDECCSPVRMPGMRCRCAPAQQRFFMRIIFPEVNEAGVRFRRMTETPVAQWFGFTTFLTSAQRVNSARFDQELGQEEDGETNECEDNMSQEASRRQYADEILEDCFGPDKKYDLAIPTRYPTPVSLRLTPFQMGAVHCALRVPIQWESSEKKVERLQWLRDQFIPYTVVHSPPSMLGWEARNIFNLFSSNEFN